MKAKVNLPVLGALSRDADAGTKHIPFAAPHEVGFKVGQTVQFGEADEMEEAVIVGLTDGITLSKGLLRSHELGCRIYLVKESTIDENDSEQGIQSESSDVSVSVKNSKKAGTVSIKSPYAMF